MKNAPISVFDFRFILFTLKIFGEIVTIHLTFEIPDALLNECQPFLLQVRFDVSSSSLYATRISSIHDIKNKCKMEICKTLF